MSALHGSEDGSYHLLPKRSVGFLCWRAENCPSTRQFELITQRRAYFDGSTKRVIHFRRLNQPFLHNEEARSDLLRRSQQFYHEGLSRLNGWLAHTPTDASPVPSRAPA